MSNAKSYCEFFYKGISQGIVDIPESSFESQRESCARKRGIKKMDDYCLIHERNGIIVQKVFFSKSFEAHHASFKKGKNRMKYLSDHNNFVK